MAQAGAPSRGSLRRPFRPVHLFILPLVAVLLAFLVWPILALVKESLASPEGTLSLRNYSDLLLPGHREALLNSLGLSALVALVSTALCLAPAWILVRYSFPGKPLLRSLLALPP